MNARIALAPRRAFILVAAVLALGGCKTKLEKCQGVCQRIRAEKLAECRSGDASCAREVDEWVGSCNDLCQTAMGSEPTVENREERCKGGDGESCVQVGGAYLLGRNGMTKDDTKAAVYFTRGCDAGSMFSCETLGKLYREGRGVPRDPTRALELLSRACDANQASACTSAGLELIRANNRAAAARVLAKACDGNDGIGCMGLGGMYLHGNGVHKSRTRARALLAKACSLGEHGACSKVRTL